ncbi:MAG: VCBS repeat-containing protein [Planctomycetota bacterium]
MTARAAFLSALVVASLASCDGREAAPPGTADATGVSSAAAPEPSGGWFTDVTEPSGVDFVHVAGFTAERHLPETMGGGGALFDVENDGDLDLYLVQSGPLPIPETAPRPQDAPPNRLFLGDGRGRFEDATARSGAAAHTGYGQGVAVGDVDGDGLQDLYVTNFGPDALLRNAGDARFVDATREAGLGDPRWTVGATFFDADLDGDLDLYVTGYVAIDVLHPEWCGDRRDGWRSYCHPDRYPGLPDVFYLNDGRGHFEIANEKSGLADTAGKGLGALPVDYDQDGDLDLYVANDSVENRLWRNRGDATFEDATLESGTGVDVDGMTEAGMGLACGDVDGDLDVDLFVTNYDGESNTLYLGGKDGSFTDGTVRAGMEAASRLPVGFGTVMCDFDLDGDLDVAVANGHIIHNIQLYEDGKTWAQPPALFVNRGDGRFDLAQDELGALGARDEVGRALLAGDLDGDGDEDLVLVTCGGRARVLRNDAGDGRAALVVRDVPPHAAVRVLFDDGGERLLVAGPQPSYAGSSAPDVITGLLDRRVTSVRVVGDPRDLPPGSEFRSERRRTSRDPLGRAAVSRRGAPSRTSARVAGSDFPAARGRVRAARCVQSALRRSSRTTCCPTPETRSA